jgi:hypothetical protein
LVKRFKQFSGGLIGVVTILGRIGIISRKLATFSFEKTGQAIIEYGFSGDEVMQTFER